MTDRSRTPSQAPPLIRPAVARATDPAADVLAHYQEVWQAQRHDLPLVNHALTVEVHGFIRYRDDWLGVVITPWFLNLFLLSGGGELWGDIPAGQRRYLNLPCGTLQFIADDDPALGPYQYCPLIAPVSGLSDMGAARQIAVDALKAVFSPPPEPSPAPAAASGEETAKAPVSRRGFLLRLTGRH